MNETFEQNVIESPAAADYKAEKKNLSRIGLMMFIYSVLVFVVQIISMNVLNLCSETVQQNFGIIITMLPAYLICVPVAMLLINKTAKPAQIHKEKMSVGELFCAFLVAEAFMYAGNLIGNIIGSVIALIPKASNVNPLLNLLGQSSLIQTVLVIAIAAPIAEELIFRKALMDKLGRYGDKTAIVVSAVAFSLFHGNIIQFIYAFLVGLVLGYVYRKSGNILYSIILHILINFNGTVLSQIVLQKSGMAEISQQAADGAAPSTEMIMQNAGGIMLFGLYALVLIAMAVAGFAIFFINKKKLVFREGEVKLEKGKRFGTIALNVGAILYIILWIAMAVITVLQ